jgi:peptide/nickel transport system substrate-binding protein
LKLPSALNRYGVGALVAAVAILGSGAVAHGAKPAPGQRPQGRVVTGGFAWRADLDPQMAWSNYGLNVVDDTYIPLLTFRHANGAAGSEVIPGLARSLPRITDGGRTYTLYLRKGLRYSNGAPVEASDFKYAVERLFRLGSGGAYLGPELFYDDIVGAARFERKGRGGIPGIVTDDSTGKIVIRLRRPEVSFSRKLAMTWVAPVPAGTPMRSMSADPPPATGPYAITHATRQGWTYERNPEWASRNGKLMPRIPGGHLGTIQIKVVHSIKQQVSEVEAGKLDWMSGELPGPTYESLRHRFPTRVRLEPTLSTEYFWLNTSKPPFDSVQVRRAVDYAVDRKVFAALSGGQLQPTQQILPPALPGYRKLSLYPHDMAKARGLIAAADPLDRDITLWTYAESGDLAPFEYTVYFAAVLDELGFTVHIKTLSVERYFSAIENPKTPHLDAGISDWFANYPDPGAYLSETIGTPVTPFYNENLAQFSAPGLRRELERLDARPTATTPASGYAALDRSYMRLAPWVPIGNLSEPLFTSSRIDLGAVVSNPSFGVALSSLRLK